MKGSVSISRGPVKRKVITYSIRLVIDNVTAVLRFCMSGREHLLLVALRFASLRFAGRTVASTR